MLLVAPAPAGADGEDGALAPLGPLAGTIVAYSIVNGRRIPERLSEQPGDPVRGAGIFADPGRGGCIACHGYTVEGARDPMTPDIATWRAVVPPDSFARAPDPGELRLWLVAPQTLNPETEMPAYYVAGTRRQPRDPLYGGPQLTAQEIEDVLAYLLSLREDG
ncbi:MAG: c-type cytochrome [Pseudomonadota bacterium]